MMAARVVWEHVEGEDWPMWRGRVEVQPIGGDLSVYMVSVARFEYGELRAHASLLSGHVEDGGERARRSEAARRCGLRTAQPLLPKAPRSALA